MIRSLVIIFVFVLFSCDRIVYIDSVDAEHQLAVNALIQPDGVDSLLLSSTYNTVGTIIVNEDDRPGKGVSGAAITVITEGDAIGRYVEKNEGVYYYEGESFQENKQYSLSIKHPDFQEVFANTTMPVTPEIGFATHPDNGEKVKEIPEADLKVLLAFDDPENTYDFYMITASNTYETHYTDYDENDQLTVFQVLHNEDAQINSKSSIIELNFNGSSYKFAQNDIDWESYYRVKEDKLIFSDKLFNGQRVAIPVDLKLFEFNHTTSIHLTLTAISEEYFLLVRSLAAYRKSERGIFPEALQVYSNVENGQGVWAAKSSKTISLDVSGFNFNND